MEIQDRNYGRLSESVNDADYYMCNDGGLILSNIETKQQRLKVIGDFMLWAGLKKAVAVPSGI